MVHEAPTGVEVEVFHIDSIATSEREYQGHQAQEVWGVYGPPQAGALAPGTVMVPMDQPLARVIFTLLEPRSDDGLVAWGLLSGMIGANEDYPIIRATPGGLPGLSMGFNPSN